MNNKCKFAKDYFDDKNIDDLKASIRPKKAWENIEKDTRIWIDELDIPEKTTNILEIGAGIGRLLKPLSEIYKCSGIDASKSMVSHSKIYAPKANIVLCDGLGDINFKDNSFDFVFSLIVFQHIEDTTTVKEYIHNAFLVLNSGGTGRFQLLESRPIVEHRLKTYHDINNIIDFMATDGYKNIIKRKSLYSWVMISGTK